MLRSLRPGGAALAELAEARSRGGLRLPAVTALRPLRFAGNCPCVNPQLWGSPGWGVRGGDPGGGLQEGSPLARRPQAVGGHSARHARAVGRNALGD